MLLLEVFNEEYNKPAEILYLNRIQIKQLKCHIVEVVIQVTSPDDNAN